MLKNRRLWRHQTDPHRNELIENRTMDHTRNFFLPIRRENHTAMGIIMAFDTR